MACCIKTEIQSIQIRLRNNKGLIVAALYKPGWNNNVFDLIRQWV